MKKILALSLIIIMLWALSACTLNFSHEIDSAMGDLNQAIKDNAESFIKEDEKFSSDSGSNNVDVDKIPFGTEVGERLPSYEVNVFNSSGLLPKKIDPTDEGKVTVINFWGTWCHYCLVELPYFDTVASEYGDDISIIAIHTDDYFLSTAVDFVRENYSGSEITFAKDTGSDTGLDVYYTMCGGYGSYPYTVIIDENGIITYKAVGAISESTLRTEIEKALS